MANAYNKHFKANSFYKIIDAYHDLKQISDPISQDPQFVQDSNFALRVRTLRNIINNESQLGFVHQESWLLNPIPASELEY